MVIFWTLKVIYLVEKFWNYSIREQNSRLTFVAKSEYKCSMTMSFAECWYQSHSQWDQCPSPGPTGVAPTYYNHRSLIQLYCIHSQLRKKEERERGERKREKERGGRKREGETEKNRRERGEKERDRQTDRRRETEKEQNHCYVITESKHLPGSCILVARTVEPDIAVPTVDGVAKCW